MFSSKGHVLKVNNNASVTIREIEYSIRLADKDSSFSEILGILRDELTAFRNHTRNSRQGTENTIRDFIKNNIERSIILRENTRVYFLDYKEKEGSLKIGFTLMIITNYINYASLRQELDSLVKDNITDYFEEILERHIPVKITVQAIDNEIVTLEDSLSVPKPSRPKRDFLTRTIAMIALTISIALSGLYVFNISDTKLKNENARLKEDYIDMLLEKKIIEAVKDQKFTVKLYKIADTVGSSSKKTTESPAR